MEPEYLFFVFCFFKVWSEDRKWGLKMVTNTGKVRGESHFLPFLKESGARSVSPLRKPAP